MCRPPASSFKPSLSRNGPDLQVLRDQPYLRTLTSGKAGSPVLHTKEFSEIKSALRLSLLARHHLTLDLTEVLL